MSARSAIGDMSGHSEPPSDISAPMIKISCYSNGIGNIINKIVANGIVLKQRYHNKRRRDMRLLLISVALGM